MAEKDQRIYTVPLRDAYKSPRVYRARKAIKYLRDYLKKHLKSEVAIGPGLNQKIWARGIKKPPSKVKVTVSKEDDKYRAELFGYVPKKKPEKKKVEKKKSLAGMAKDKISEKSRKPENKEKNKSPVKAPEKDAKKSDSKKEESAEAEKVKEDKKDKTAEKKEPEKKEEKKGEK